MFKERDTKYVLNHNKGSMSFESLMDAIHAMWLLAEYDQDCDASFSCTSYEAERIFNKVCDSGFYSQGYLSISL